MRRLCAACAVVFFMVTVSSSPKLFGEAPPLLRRAPAVRPPVLPALEQVRARGVPNMSPAGTGDASGVALAGVPRRGVLVAAAAAAMGVFPTLSASARPEGVNKPELLPSYQTNVIDLERFLTSGEAKRIDNKLTALQEKTGIKVRLLCQAYPKTPGLAIKDYWGVDSNTVVVVVDKFAERKGSVNILNFNVGEGVKLALPNQFWNRLQSTFGITTFVRDNGEDIAIQRAIDTIDFCLRDGFCVDVPLQFKNPAEDMYGAQDPASKALRQYEDAGRTILSGVTGATEKVFGP